MSRNTMVGTAWTGKVYVNIISINYNLVLVREILSGVEHEVPFTDLQGVWPVASVVETFDELVKDFDIPTAYRMFVLFTQTTGWADIVRSAWTDSYTKRA